MGTFTCKVRARSPRQTRSLSHQSLNLGASSTRRPPIPTRSADETQTRDEELLCLCCKRVLRSALAQLSSSRVWAILLRAGLCYRGQVSTGEADETGERTGELREQGKIKEVTGSPIALHFARGFNDLFPKFPQGCPVLQSQRGHPPQQERNLS